MGMGFASVTVGFLFGLVTTTGATVAMVAMVATGAGASAAMVGVEVTVVVIPGVTSTGCCVIEMMATGTALTATTEWVGGIGAGVSAATGGGVVVAKAVVVANGVVVVVANGVVVVVGNGVVVVVVVVGGAGVETVGMEPMGGKNGGTAGGGRAALRESTAVREAPEP